MKDIETAKPAAGALRPLAGKSAYWLFTWGLIGIGMLARASSGRLMRLRNRRIGKVEIGIAECCQNAVLGSHLKRPASPSFGRDGRPAY
jgi:hypothetical protein